MHLLAGAQHCADDGLWRGAQLRKILAPKHSIHLQSLPRSVSTIIVCLRTAEHIPTYLAPGGRQRLFRPVAQARIQVGSREANTDLLTKPKHLGVGFDNTTRPKPSACHFCPQEIPVICAYSLHGLVKDEEEQAALFDFSHDGSDQESAKQMNIPCMSVGESSDAAKYEEHGLAAKSAFEKTRMSQVSALESDVIIRHDCWNVHMTRCHLDSFRSAVAD